MQTNSQRMFNDLKQDIRSGILAGGALLPSENELAKRYSISRPTVRRVLDKLVDLRLLEKRAGIGSFVIDPRCSAETYMFSPFKIGVVGSGSQNIFNHYSSAIIDGINKSIYGKDVYLKSLDCDPDLDDFSGTDALLSFSSEIDCDILSRAPRPSVICNTAVSDAKIGRIGVDNRLEARRGVEYLIRSGFKRIALIGGISSGFGSMAKRMQGYYDAFANLDVKVPENLQLLADTGRIPEMLRFTDFIKNNEFDAAFFVNAMHFKNFMLYYTLIKKRQLSDLPCLIFDDVEPFPELAEFPCAYIKMPLEKFGIEIIDYLRRKAHDTEYPLLNKIFNCQMIIRY